MSKTSNSKGSKSKVVDMVDDGDAEVKEHGVLTNSNAKVVLANCVVFDSAGVCEIIAFWLGQGVV
jgi:hypothetical protein